MYLGAALRKHFAEEDKGNELVVWGIELCPPIDTDETGAPTVMGLQNVFRGYVAREELLQGVPLTKDEPDDEQLHQPFDINIVFDGGATTTIADRISKDDIWKALDRAAAQTTACLLNGAAGGDVDESTNWLKQGKRWNAYLVHVVSELSYNSACRYLRYRVSLPWHRSRESWDKTGIGAKRDALLRRIDEDIRPMLAEEKDPTVRERIEYLVKLAEPTRGMNSLFRGKSIQEKMVTVIAEEERLYRGLCDEGSTPDRVIPKTDPFCVNIVLPANLRQEATEKWRDSGTPEPIGDVLGMAGALAVRSKIEDLLSRVLRRNDYQVSDSSQAAFEQIIAISIEDRSRAVDNEEFRPSSEFLRDFISAGRQDMPGAFNALPPYNLSEYLQSFDTESHRKWNMPKTLSWHLPGSDEYEIPVEYSFLALARCRQVDGFRDISTFGALKNHYDKIISNPDNWREHARYHSGKPPGKMEEGCTTHTGETAQSEGDIASDEPRSEATTNGYRDNPSSVPGENS